MTERTIERAGGAVAPEQVPVRFDEAFNRADVEAVMGLFDEMATMRMTNGAVIETDRSGLQAALTRLLAMRPRIHNEVRRVVRCDDVALVVMDWTLTVRDPEGRDQVDRGTATQVMKRQGDGSWRLKISNPAGVARGRREMRNRTVETAGARLVVGESGAGEPALVFLHYWGGSARTWDPVVASMPGSVRCIALNQRGWGGSVVTDGRYDLKALADDVLAVTAALGVRRYVIVGHSMGGKVAQIVAARRPAGLERLVLVAPAPPTPMQVPKEVRAAMLESYRSREGVGMALGVLAGSGLRDEVRERVIADTLGGAEGAKRAWPERGMTEDVSAGLEGVTLPVDVLIGEFDQVEREAVVRPALSRFLPQATFSIVRGAGHLLPLEAPGAVRGALVDRLASPGAGRSESRVRLRLEEL